MYETVSLSPHGEHSKGLWKLSPSSMPSSSCLLQVAFTSPAMPRGGPNEVPLGPRASRWKGSHFDILLTWESSVFSVSLTVILK